MCGMDEDLDPREYDEEEVDGLPVLVDVRPIEPAPPAPLPAVQTAAVAATGFVAGAATVALMMHRHARRLARMQGAPLRRPGGLPISGSRTFLVHIHTLRRPGE
jgi:hypothetical protein